jgi:hypothetical protein
MEKIIYIGLLLLVSFKSSGQIVLSDEALQIKPAGYFIAEVSDERVRKNSIAQLVVKTESNKTAITTADLQGGIAKGIGGFLARNFKQDKSLTPVVLGVKDLKITETVIKDLYVEGHITLNLSFGLQKDYGVEHLIDYRGGLNYRRNGGNLAAIERDLRSLLKAGLVYFNDWKKENDNSNRNLAKNVKISFTDYTEPKEGDTIYYAAGRPLTWADFQSRNRPTGNYQAMVMPSIGYTQEAKIVKGTILVNIAVKAYVPKSACWAAYEGRDDYALNHEQRHFDIVKIIAEQFKQKVLAKKLTPDTFEAIINMQYLDSFRDMNAMQKAYDKETSHGLNKIAQEAWNHKIDQALVKPM